jgi:hypothetical protein
MGNSLFQSVEIVIPQGGKMKFTQHAEKRKKQRGFSDQIVKIIKRHGRSMRAPGGATRIFFGKKEYQKMTEELRKAIRILDRAKGGSLVISPDQSLLTVYKNR